MFRRRRRLIDLTVKQQAGLTAKRAGESWENLLKGEANKQGWAAQKLPDACRTIGANKIIRGIEDNANKKDYKKAFELAYHLETLSVMLKESLVKK